MQEVTQEVMQFAQSHPVLSLAWIILLVLVVITTLSALFSKVKTVTRSEVTRLINTENGVVVDVRSREDFRRGHIVGALNVQASEVKKGNLGALEKYKLSPVIVVCASGHAAMQSASKLSSSGFDKVMILKEGMSGWDSENLPLVRGK